MIIQRIYSRKYLPGANALALEFANATGVATPRDGMVYSRVASRLRKQRSSQRGIPSRGDRCSCGCCVSSRPETVCSRAELAFILRMIHANTATSDYLFGILADASNGFIFPFAFHRREPQPFALRDGMLECARPFDRYIFIYIYIVS